MLLNITQLSTTLGVSRATIRRYLAAGLIPKSVKIGRSLRWRESDIDTWLQQRCPPCAEAPEAATVHQ